MDYLRHFIGNKRVIHCWVVAYVAFCFAVVLSTLYMVLVSKWYGPFRDMWEIVGFLRLSAESGLNIESLIEPYAYSHRLLVPRLLFYFDHAFFKGTNDSVLFVSVICQLLMFSLFLKISIFQENNYTIKIITFATLLAMTFLGTLQYNLLYTFDVQWFVVTTSVVFSFFAIVFFKGPYRSFIFSILFLLPGIFSSFSSLLAIPSLMLFIYGANKNKRTTVTQCLLCLLVLGLYFVDFSSQGTGLFIKLGPNSLVDSYFSGGLWHGVLIVTYWLTLFPVAFLSNPLSQSFLGLWPACIFVFIVLVYFFYVWVKIFLRKYQPSSKLEWFSLLLIVYGYGVGFSVAIGRGWFFDTVYADRFQNIVILFWVGVLLFFFSKLPYKNTRYKNIYLLFLPVSFFLFFGIQQYYFVNKGLFLGEEMRLANGGIVLGLSDDYHAVGTTVSRFHIVADAQKGIDIIENGAQYLKRTNTGPFNYAYTGQLKNTASFDLTQLSSCEESYKRIYKLPKGETKITVQIKPINIGSHGLVLHKVTGEWVGLVLPMYGNDLLENINKHLVGTQMFEGFLLNDSRFLEEDKKIPLVLQDVKTEQPICIVESPL